MVVFLTSSPTGDLDGKFLVEGLDYRNDFNNRVRSVWKENSRVLMITAFPSDIQASEQMTDFFYHACLKSGLSMSCFDLWDCRTPIPTKELVESYDVIFLGGGHVPTQNKFLEYLGLREKLENYQGVIIGISAGTMNSADTVYAQPEEAGEATNPHYSRWIKGLGITNINVIPHFQMVRDHYLDGMRLIDDITLSNTYGHEMIALIDGSYIMQTDSSTILYGEGYRLFDGTIQRICEYGNSIQLD